MLHRLRAIAINGGGGGKQHAFHARIACSDEEVQRGIEIDGVGGDWLVDGGRDGGHGGLMEDPITTGDSLREQRGIAHIALNDLDGVASRFPGEVIEASGAQIVENDHTGTVGAERLGEMRTDKPGAAGDECLHGAEKEHKMTARRGMRASPF